MAGAFPPLKPRPRPLDADASPAVQSARSVSTKKASINPFVNPFRSVKNASLSNIGSQPQPTELRSENRSNITNTISSVPQPVPIKSPKQGNLVTSSNPIGNRPKERNLFHKSWVGNSANSANLSSQNAVIPPVPAAASGTVILPTGNVAPAAISPKRNSIHRVDIPSPRRRRSGSETFSSTRLDSPRSRRKRRQKIIVGFGTLALIAIGAMILVVVLTHKKDEGDSTSSDSNVQDGNDSWAGKVTVTVVDPCANIDLTNPSTSRSSSRWKISLTLLSTCTIGNVWGGKHTLTGKNFAIEPTANDASVLTPGQTTKLGFCAVGCNLNFDAESTSAIIYSN